MLKISPSNLRRFSLLLCVFALTACLSGCMPGARNAQGEELPFLPQFWEGEVHARYAVVEKKTNASAGVLEISHEPVGAVKDKINVSLEFKSKNEPDADTVKVSALLDRATLRPMVVTKTARQSGRDMKIQSEYQGRMLRVSLEKNKKKKDLMFEVTSKVYYENDVFLYLLQTLDFEKMLKMFAGNEKKKNSIHVALANPQIGQVPAVEVHFLPKTEALLFSGGKISCYHIEISYAKKIMHHAWYEEKLPHRLLKYENADKVFMLESFNKSKPPEKDKKS